MTKKKTNLSGYIKRKFSNAEVAALIDDLGLIPEFMITPSLIDTFRDEIRAKYSNKEYLRENVELLVGTCLEFLSSEYGKMCVRQWRERFEFQLPLNRDE